MSVLAKQQQISTQNVIGICHRNQQSPNPSVVKSRIRVYPHGRPGPYLCLVVVMRVFRFCFTHAQTLSFFLLRFHLFIIIGDDTMGKKNKAMKENSDGTVKQCPLTLFVSNLPYSFTNSQVLFFFIHSFLFLFIIVFFMLICCWIEFIQLEQTFSEVGPVRRCFMVTQKGNFTN